MGGASSRAAGGVDKRRASAPAGIAGADTGVRTASTSVRAAALAPRANISPTPPSEPATSFRSSAVHWPEQQPEAKGRKKTKSKQKKGGGFFGALRGKKRTPQEVVVTVDTALDADHRACTGSAIFDASVAALAQSRRSEDTLPTSGSGSSKRGGGGGSSARSSGSGDGGSSQRARSSSGGGGSGGGGGGGGNSVGGGTMDASARPVIAATAPTEAMLQRRASIKAAAQSILQQVAETEGSVERRQEVSELLGFSAKMAAAGADLERAARALIDGKAGKPPELARSPERGRGRQSAASAAAEARQRGEQLVQQEARRRGACAALEHRLQQLEQLTQQSHSSGLAAREDMLVACRDYVSLCSSLVETLMLDLLALPQATAGAVSSYLSAVSNHRTLALKALQAEDQGVLAGAAAREAAAKRQGSIGRQAVLAEMRDARVGGPRSPL